MLAQNQAGKGSHAERGNQRKIWKRRQFIMGILVGLKPHRLFLWTETKKKKNKTNNESEELLWQEA